MLRPGVLRVTTLPEGTDALEPVLRGATATDLPALEDLLRSVDLPTAGVAEFVERFVLAEAAGRVVGAAGLEVHGRDGLLRSVAVDAGMRGNGLGARLTDRVLIDARTTGLRRVYLLTTTAEDYFPRHGFRRIERDLVSADVQRSVEFREACPASATVMVLELEPEDR
jgi:N-acetylglutamate synthase-like GNAT family acetyltransferase